MPQDGGIFWPRSRVQSPGIRYPVSGIRYLVSDIRYPVSPTSNNQIPNIQYPISSIRTWLFWCGLTLAGLSGCTFDKDVAPRLPDAQPSDWAWRQRTFPHGHFNHDAYRDAYEAVEKLAALSKRGSAAGSWELAGPTNVGGRISDVEFDPLEPNIVYASAATGGVFKSTDAGNTWESVFDGYAVLNVGDIGISPSDPSILYVGTGEANGGANNLQGSGVFRSTDAGLSWTNIGLEETAAIGRIIVHPDDPDHVYVAAVGSYFASDSNRGVFRTTNGGADWEQVLFVSDSTGAIDLVMHPEDADILYAAMWHRWRRPATAELVGPTSGIYRSRDGGDTWEELGPSTGLPNPNFEPVGRIGLAISASNPDILYSVYTGRDEGGQYVFTGIYKTTDGGDHWTNFDPSGKLAGQFVTGFSWFFGQVRVSPVDPNRVYVMEAEFQHTRDGGETWHVNIGGRNLHVDHHALAFQPDNPEYIISGNDGGLSISEDGGLNWRKIRGLPITQFYEIEVDEKAPDLLFGGTQDNQTLTTPTGAVDDWVPLEFGFGAGGDGFYVKVTYEPAGHRAIYAESQWGNLYKAFPADDEFRSIAPDIAAGDIRNWNTPYMIAPHTVAIIYYGTHSVYRSPNRGASNWERISPRLTDSWGTNFGTITTMDAAPSFPEALIVGTDDGHVWVSNNDGGSWTDVSAGLPQRWVTRVEFDPDDPSVAYATFSGLKWRDPLSHVFRTDHFGEAWIDISGNLPDAPVNAFAIDPIDTDVVYVGTDVGAFVNFNRGGGSWEVLGDGLPRVAVYDMKVNADPHFLVVGTHGRSMHKIDLSGIVTAVESSPASELPAGLVLEGNYPNPFSSSTSIRFTTGRQAEIIADVFDLSGRKVATLASGTRPGGVHDITWDGTSDGGTKVASGVYIYRIATHDGRSQSGKMSLMR